MKEFPFSPRFLGIDNVGREILSYIPGWAGTYPMSAAVRSTRALRETTILLKQFHDMTSDLVERDLNWPRQPRPDAVPEVICHYDFAPYNVIFQGADPVGIIDFDNAGPGRRIDDIAYFAYCFTLLSAVENYRDGGWDRDVDAHGRLRTILDLYPTDEQSQLPDLILGRLYEMRQWIFDRAAEGDSDVEVHIRDGHTLIYENDIRFIESTRITCRSRDLMPALSKLDQPVANLKILNKSVALPYG